MSKISEGTLVPISLIALVGGALAASMIYVIANITKLEQTGIAAGSDIERHEKVLGIITGTEQAIRDDLSGVKATQVEVLKRLDRMGAYMQERLK